MNAYEELIERVKRIPIARLPDVVDAIDGKLTRGRGLLVLEHTPSTFRELAEMERRMIASALQRAGGNQSQAAKLCGMQRKAFARRLAKYNVK